MVNLAMADGATSCWNDKYHWAFWRPRAAIREGETDGNPATIGDPTWESLFHPSTGAGLATPPFPDHPSGHGCVSGVVLRTFREYFGRTRSHSTSARAGSRTSHGTTSGSHSR